MSPAVFVYLRAYGPGTKPGERVGFNVTIRNAGKVVTTLQPTAPFRIDATAAFRLTGFRPVKGKTYTVEVVANVFSGGGRDAETHADRDREVADASCGPGRASGPTAL